MSQFKCLSSEIDVDDYLELVLKVFDQKSLGRLKREDTEFWIHTNSTPTRELVWPTLITFTLISN